MWGYNKKGKFVCRVEVNGAGIAVYDGNKGLRRIADVNWEKLVDRLDKKKKKEI